MRTKLGALTATLTLVLTLAPTGVASGTSAQPGRSDGVPDSARAAKAHEALDKARGLFKTKRVKERHTDHADEHGDATMVLRDLRLRYRDLSSRERKTADSLFARPTEGAADRFGHGYPAAAPLKHDCSSQVCIHWVNDAQYEDAPDLADGPDSNTRPDWIDTNVATFDKVWKHIVDDLGYRAPLSDATSADSGPTEQLDIYLAELGGMGIYGYCTTDDPDFSRWDVSAYCVIDNDFKEFPAGPLASLKVTGAHEFFHAVQFAYDVGEDRWLMESTAAWIEDEVYDSINDNIQFLANSPLRQPGVPLDYGDGGYQYGSWIFWKFLSEYFGSRGNTDPSVVREIWEKADRSAGAPDYYSLKGLQRVVLDRGVDLRTVFARFGAANRFAGRWYDEGALYADRGFEAPVTKSFTFSSSRRGIKPRAVEMNHLSNSHLVFKRGSNLRGEWRLRVKLDLPAAKRGSKATLVVHRKDGRVWWIPVKLNSAGDGQRSVPFARSKVKHVALTLTNASIRSFCGRTPPTDWSCSGKPMDDELLYVFKAQVYRPR